MKIVHFNFRRIFTCFSFLVTIFKKILFRGRRRKSSQTKDDTQACDTLPTSVKVTTSEDQVREKLKSYVDVVLISLNAQTFFAGGN